jgi:hypothetical protein
MMFSFFSKILLYIFEELSTCKNNETTRTKKKGRREFKKKKKVDL